MKAALLALGLLLLACSKPEAPAHRTEPWPAHAGASSTRPSTAPRHYRLTDESQVRFSIPGKRGKVSGRLPITQGQLQLDPREPKNSRASIDVDLTALSIETALPEGVELSGTPHSVGLQWLELGAGVPSERRARFASAHFELVSLEGPTFLELGGGRKPASTRATAVGTLLLHGFRAPLRIEAVLTVLSPERLSIRSAGPFVVPLAAHDVMARDATGMADPLATVRAADWVGKSVRVEVELFATLGN